jgi:hypothetical protein
VRLKPKEVPRADTPGRGKANPRFAGKPFCSRETRVRGRHRQPQRLGYGHIPCTARLGHLLTTKAEFAARV